VALDDVALIEHRTAGSRHALTVTARSGHVVVRCDEAQRSPLDRWTRRLRLRLAPPGNPASAGNAAGPDLDAFLPAADEGIVAFGHRGGRLRRCCLLTVTSRELIIEQSWRDRGRPWRWLSRTLYLPRQAMSSSAARGKTLRLESAGTAVRVRLPARKTAAAAAAWLASELSGRTSNVS
jgi:hypothetical protein